MRALAASTGGGAVNEDDEELDDDDAITERYDAKFRKAYVTWGPTVLAEQLDDPSNAISLSGPWTDVRLDGAELITLRKANRKDDQFAAAVIAQLVAAQDRARPLHAQLDSGDVAAVIASPDGPAALEGWVSQQFGSNGVARVRRVIGGLPDSIVIGTESCSVARWTSPRTCPSAIRSPRVSARSRCTLPPKIRLSPS